jgi:hypothetical protein
VTLPVYLRNGFVPGSPVKRAGVPAHAPGGEAARAAFPVECEWSPPED